MRPGAGIVPGVGVINVRPNASGIEFGILMHSSGYRRRVVVGLRTDRYFSRTEDESFQDFPFDMVSLSGRKIWTFLETCRVSDVYK